MAYDLDFAEDASLRYHVKSFFLYPTFWTDNEPTINFTTDWKQVHFTKANRNSIPMSKGVYAFVLVPRFKHLVPTRYLFYVGKTNRTLHKRYGEYLDEKDGKGKPRKKVFKMLNLYKDYMYFCYAALPDMKHVDELEECLLNTFVPHVNTLIPRARIKPELQGIYESN